MPARINLTWRVFGRLEVLGIAEGIKPLRWHCRCICGNSVNVLAQNLRDGITKSCGCLRKETTAAHNRTAEQRRVSVSTSTVHGQYGSPTYTSWRGMIERCTNPKHKAWKYYGGIGVTVCERWRTSYCHFVDDMGLRPNGKSLDRYPNPAGGYFLGNCRWATPKEQEQNKRQKLPTNRGY